MIFDNLKDLRNKKYFAIIIGSGPAGISTALKLEEKGIESLILEAGSEDFTSSSLEFLNGEVSGDKYNDLKISRLRQFGGSSGHWGGTCSLLKESDFDGWPIKKFDLNDYQKDAKKFLNIKKNFYFSKFSKKLDSFNMQWSNVRFKEKYFEYIKSSKKIHLSLNTNFHYFEGSDGNVSGLICEKNGLHKLQSKFYILSCGGIENSRSLLITKIKNPNLFRYNLPIGKFYMDHPKHDIGEGILVYDKLHKYLNRMNINQFPITECENIQFSLNKDQVMNKDILNSAVNLKLQRVTANSSIIKQASCVAPKFIQKIYNSLNKQNVYKFNLNILQEQFPYENNSIELSSKLDPNGLPLPKINWKRSEKLKKSAEFIINEISDVFIEQNIGRISIIENMLETKDYHMTLGFHQMGGTRMGKDRDNSVVDKNLLVFGFKNLYINGSSIFRTGGYAHPTFTIVQLASRLGDHLSKI